MKKIQLKIESLDNKVLALYIKFLIKVLCICQITPKVFYLPHIIKRFTFLKSPHVFKKSKEHFDIKKHRVIIIFSFNLQKLKLFLINRPSAVKIKIIYKKRG
jgi:ribosomal protein S10